MGLKKLEEEFNQTSGERVLLRVLVWYWYCTSDKRKMITTAKIAPEHTKKCHIIIDTYAIFLCQEVQVSSKVSLDGDLVLMFKHQVE